jgi:hypothetical protein
LLTEEGEDGTPESAVAVLAACAADEGEGAPLLQTREGRRLRIPPIAAGLLDGEEALELPVLPGEGIPVLPGVLLRPAGWLLKCIGSRNERLLPLSEALLSGLSAPEGGGGKVDIGLMPGAGVAPAPPGLEETGVEARGEAGACTDGAVAVQPTASVGSPGGALPNRVARRERGAGLCGTAASDRV